MKNQMLSSTTAIRVDTEIANFCENREPPYAVTMTINVIQANVIDISDTPPRGP